MLNLPISDIMNDHPIKVKSDVSIRNVAHLLLRYRISGILVVERDNMDTLIGVFTTTDFLNLMDMALAGGGADNAEMLGALAERPVGEFVSRGFSRLQQTSPVSEAIAVMRKNNVLTIPVYDGEKLIGVIGRHDVINIAFA